MPFYLIHFGSYLVSICAYHELHELTTNQSALIFQLYLHAFLIRFMTAQKMKFPINDFSNKCDQAADLVTFTKKLIILIICGNIELNTRPKKDDSCDKLPTMPLESQQHLLQVFQVIST